MREPPLLRDLGGPLSLAYYSNVSNLTSRGWAYYNDSLSTWTWHQDPCLDGGLLKDIISHWWYFPSLGSRVGSVWIPSSHLVTYTMVQFKLCTSKLG